MKRPWVNKQGNRNCNQLGFVLFCAQKGLIFPRENGLCFFIWSMVSDHSWSKFTVKSHLILRMKNSFLNILPRECIYQKTHSFNTRDHSTNAHHQKVKMKIRLIIFSAAKDREALYNQQKQDWELTVVRSWTPYCQIQT